MLKQKYNNKKNQGKALMKKYFLKVHSDNFDNVNSGAKRINLHIYLFQPEYTIGYMYGHMNFKNHILFVCLFR